MDLNNDGYDDLLTGKYSPNYVTWFKGSKDGFEKGIKLQENRLITDEHLKRGIYKVGPDAILKCTPRFADIDGDKDLDLFVTDFNFVLLNKNEGTSEKPLFGRREVILTTKGDTIRGTSPTVAVVDWDCDGILDLIVSDNADSSISFYKGVGNAVYEPGIPLYKNRKNKKFIPGSSFWIYSTDWNNDGIPDLLVGTKITYINGKIDYGNYYSKEYINKKMSKLSQKEQFKLFKNMKSYGHVYLLLGK